MTLFKSERSVPRGDEPELEQHQRHASHPITAFSLSDAHTSKRDSLGMVVRMVCCHFFHQIAHIENYFWRSTNTCYAGRSSMFMYVDATRFSSDSDGRGVECCGITLVVQGLMIHRAQPWVIVFPLREPLIQGSGVTSARPNESEG